MLLYFTYNRTLPERAWHQSGKPPAQTSQNLLRALWLAVTANVFISFYQLIWFHAADCTALPKAGSSIMLVLCLSVKAVCCWLEADRCNSYLCYCWSSAGRGEREEVSFSWWTLLFLLSCWHMGHPHPFIKSSPGQFCPPGLIFDTLTCTTQMATFAGP